jgi:Ca2+-binding RTX toxin-like protein
MSIIENDTGEATIEGSTGSDEIAPPTSGSTWFDLYYDFGQSDNDSILAGDGDDWVFLTPGTDTLSGGNGLDTLSVNIFDTIIVTEVGALQFDPLGDPTYRYQYAGVRIDTALGTYELNFLHQNPQPFVPDELHFSGTITGFEVIEGSFADDVLLGSNGGQKWAGDPLRYETFRPGGGNDVINGRGNYDTLSYASHLLADANPTTGITVRYGGHAIDDGFGGTDNFLNIEYVEGSGLSDTFIGSNADELMSGYIDGADRFFGGGGVDRVTFGYYLDIGHGVTANLTTGNGIGFFGAALKFQGIEELYGSNLADTFTGSAKDNYLFGALGNDSIYGWR